MNRLTVAAGMVLALFLVTSAGCSKKQQGQASGDASSLGSGTGTVAGLKWSIPKRWTPGADRPMRTATYSIPPSEGDTEQGECAIFHFGNEGGGVDANIERWISQFEATGIPARAQKDVGGLKVTMVQIAGTYLNPSGPMMASGGKKENFRLLGAIVEGSQGNVFFKFTGPAKTVGAAESEFNAMVESISKI